MTLKEAKEILSIMHEQMRFESDTTMTTEMEQHINNELTALCIAISALEKQIPQKPLYHKEKYECHTWKKRADGKVDNWAFEQDFHNGPICEICGYTFCESCNPDGYKDTDCTVQYYTCPRCGEKVTKEKKCCDCGQALDLSDWSEK